MNRPSYWILTITWVASAIALFFLAVPSGMSVSTFFWVNAGALAIGATVAASVRAAGPTRSIAHVLYETEQQAGPRR